MASIAQAVIDAGQKKCKTAREQLEAIESNKKSVNRKRKQLVASASEPHNRKQLEMWANAQRDGRPAEYRWRPLFNAAVWMTPTTTVPCNIAA